MTDSLSLAQEEYFDKVTYQGKTIKVGDRVIVRQAGEEKVVEVTSIIKKQGHFWVGYEANQQFFPWPLVRLAQTAE
jgi:hypothetical protein